MIRREKQDRNEIFKQYPKYIPNKPPPSNFVDLTGQEFEHFKVLYRIQDIQKWKTSYLCECKCENHTLFPALAHNIRSGNTHSCGCYNIQKIKEACKKYNEYDLSGEYGIGYTSNLNSPFYFDLEDYDKIKNYCWYYSNRGYIETRTNGKIIKLHRLIMGVLNSPELIVDHIYHNEYGENSSYDNRKSNLRIATAAQNSQNHKVPTNNQSGITGVHWSNYKNRWVANIIYNKEVIYLGTFKDKEEAIQARKEAEEKYFGEYNFKTYNKGEKICSQENKK